jgi:hypothetical protein
LWGNKTGGAAFSGGAATLAEALATANRAELLHPEINYPTIRVRVELFCNSSAASTRQHSLPSADWADQLLIKSTLTLIVGQ